MKDALLLVFANKQDLNGGAYLSHRPLTRANTCQPCDQRRSRTVCSSRRLPRTTCGRWSPAAQLQERVSLRDWYAHTHHHTHAHRHTNTQQAWLSNNVKLPQGGK
jgi:hypothetical protein